MTELPPLTTGVPPRPGLTFGFAACDQATMAAGMPKLKAALGT